ncbi:MAG: DNA methyltransferase [Promethearchaeota archaeon]
MTDPIKNKKKISISNKLNDLTAKEWLINTKSVWEYSDYHLNTDDSREIRYLRNLILFFTKKNEVILSPNYNRDILDVAEREGRVIVSKATKEVDFILIQAERDFPDLKDYINMVLSAKFKSELNDLLTVLKYNKYFCLVVRDFYFQRNLGLILYHYDLANLLTSIGFDLKGLTVWIPGKKGDFRNVADPNSSIIHTYLLIFRKTKKIKDKPVKRLLEFQLNYDDKKLLAKNTIYYNSYVKSITPTRDKFKTWHPATFPEPDIKNLIEFYTNISNKPKILDPFCGVGSTLIACLELNIEGYGIELTKKWIDLTRDRFFSRGMPIKINRKIYYPPQESQHLLIEKEGKKNLLIQNLIHGDAREIVPLFLDNYFDFIVTSPPYWGILTKKIDHKTKKERVDKGFDTKYTIEGKDNTFHKDLANIESYAKFLNELKIIYKDCYKKLKNNKYLAIIVSDFRNGPDFYLYHCDTAKLLNNIGFKLTGLTVLHQENKNLYPYGYPYSFVSNIHHQFIIIAKKEEI